MRDMCQTRVFAHFSSFKAWKTRLTYMTIIHASTHTFTDTCYVHNGLKPIMYKSDNLQYNTLGRWVDGTNDSSIKCLMFQVLF